MKYVRIVLGVLVGLYALMGLFHAALTAGHKTGVYVATDEMTVRMVPLMEAMAWWQVVLWVVSLAIMLVAAWRLLRGGKAFMPYVVAFVLNIGGWLTIQGSGAYQTVFTAAERQLDYYMLGGLVVIGAVIWWTERGDAPAAAAA
jgi:hypothetical protein